MKIERRCLQGRYTISVPHFSEKQRFLFPLYSCLKDFDRKNEQMISETMGHLAKAEIDFKQSESLKHRSCILVVISQLILETNSNPF